MSLFFLWSSICLLYLCIIPVCVQILVVVTSYLVNSNKYYLDFQSVITPKNKYYFFLKIILHIYPKFCEMNLLEKMTTTGSALVLLNQLLNLTVSTSPSSFSVLPSSPSTLSPTPPILTSFPTSTATPTSTPSSVPTLPSPSFFFTPEFESRYLSGIFIVIFIIVARTVLSIYRFLSRVFLLKNLQPSLSYFSSFHTVLRTGTLEGKKYNYPLPPFFFLFSFKLNFLNSHAPPSFFFHISPYRFMVI